MDHEKEIRKIKENLRKPLINIDLPFSLPPAPTYSFTRECPHTHTLTHPGRSNNTGFQRLHETDYELTCSPDKTRLFNKFITSGWKSLESKSAAKNAHT